MKTRALLLTVLSAAFFAGRLYGACPGSQYPAPFTAYDGYCKLLGDLNGDGTPDAVFVGDSAVFTHFSASADPATRVLALVFPSTAYDGYLARLADGNSDQVPDLLFIGRSVTFQYNGKSDGTFAPSPVNPFVAYDGYTPLQADFNRDGEPDLVFVGNSAVFTHLGATPVMANRLLALQFAANAYQGYSSRLEDGNGDEVPDLVFAGASGEFRHNGSNSGTFEVGRTATLVPSSSLLESTLAGASSVTLQSNSFGPDGNSSLTPSNAMVLEVPAGKQAFLTFNFQANWENAIVIYRLDSRMNTLVRHMRYGTYRPKNDNNNPLPPGYYYVTGWHKEVPEGRTDPWFESLIAQRSDPTGSHPEFAFEDDPQLKTSKSYDWNDAWLIAEIR